MYLKKTLLTSHFQSFFFFTFFAPPPPPTPIPDPKSEKNPVNQLFTKIWSKFVCYRLGVNYFEQVTNYIQLHWKLYN